MSALRSHGDAGGAPLRTLEDVVSELVRVRTLERVVALAAAAATSVLRAEVLLVAIVDDAGRELRATHVGALPKPTPVSVPLDGPGLVADVARSAEPVFLRSDAHVVRDLGSAVMAPAGASVAVLPLTGADTPLGVIVLGRSSRRAFSFHERAFMLVLAGLCAPAVERARRSAGARRELTLGTMRIDVETLRVDVNERSADLTPSEFRVLMFLAEEPGRTRTRREILRRLWHTEHVQGERACDAHVCNLRRKIERDPSRPRVVVTRRGKGYALLIP